MIDKKLLAGIILFGSLWGFSECIIGSILHDTSSLPAGAIMTGGFALSILVFTRLKYQQKGMQLGMALIAGTLRLFNPFGGCFICSAIAIMAEGLIFELIWNKLAYNINKIPHQASLGITTAYLMFTGGFITTQILTPLISLAGFHLENLIIFLPQIIARGLPAALIGAGIAPATIQLSHFKLPLKDKLYYPTAISISIFCWLAVILYTSTLS